MITNAADIHDDLCGQRFDQSAGEMGDHGERKHPTSNIEHSTPNVPRAARTGGRIWLVMIWVALVRVACAAEPWVLLPEPAYMVHKGAIAIPEAKNTVLAPAQMGEFGPEFPTAAQWSAAGMTEEALLASARTVAAQWLKQIQPEFVRGANKVVEYAKLSSDKIPVCAVVLAPEFVQQFEEVFGPKPLVVMPNRSTVYVFPALAGRHEKYSAMILAAWHSKEARVSLEVFEVSAKRLRAVGVYEE
jgi:hypothetical protein